MSKYFPPKYGSTHFSCPYCAVHARQRWGKPFNVDSLIVDRQEPLKWWMLVPIVIDKTEVETSRCSHCENPTLWLSEKIIYPVVSTFPPANGDLPTDVKEVYEEAANIANQSPRAACALLRLALEMLLKSLGETGSINDSIGNLVKKGLDERVQQSLDIVRVTGNEAVHPGVIDFSDETDVEMLFGLINVIAESLISQPKRIQNLYDNLPEKAREAIEKRDGKTK